MGREAFKVFAIASVPAENTVLINCFSPVAVFLSKTITGKKNLPKAI